jgi:hypothetical protein
MNLMPLILRTFPLIPSPWRFSPFLFIDCAMFWGGDGINGRGAMIEAGSETTSMQLNNMLIGILSNSEILKRAHEELDRVVGSDRPPNFNDEPNLPYIRAIVKVLPSASSTGLVFSLNSSDFVGSNEMASN